MEAKNNWSNTNTATGKQEEGVAVTYDVAADFAVLCANCHRMIHCSDNPSNLSLFKKTLAAIKS